MLALLLLGNLHNLLSRSMFQQMRMILGLAELKLPHWDAIRRTRENIRQMLNIHIKQAETIFMNKCSSLSLKDMLGHVSMFHCIVLPYWCIVFVTQYLITLINCRNWAIHMWTNTCTLFHMTLVVKMYMLCIRVPNGGNTCHLMSVFRWFDREKKIFIFLSQPLWKALFGTMH